MSYILKTTLHGAEFFVKELFFTDDVTKGDKGFIYELRQSRREAIQFKTIHEASSMAGAINARPGKPPIVSVIEYKKQPAPKATGEQVTNSNTEHGKDNGE
jgi:hypothetical protein